MAGKFEYYEGKDGWRWRLVAGNGEPIAAGEAYSSKRAVLDGIDRVIRYSSDIHNHDVCEASAPIYHKQGGTTIVEVDS